MRFLSKLITAIALMCAVLSARAAENLVYKWRPNEVLRFDFSKVIEISDTIPLPKKGGTFVAPPDAMKRTITFSAVLVIEVNKARTTPMQLANLRFDSPHIDIPESYSFLSLNDEAKLNPTKDKDIERALEGAIKAAVWSVALGSDGSIRIKARQPKSIEDWMHETEKAALWRPKLRKLWIDVVEKTLGFGGIDSDMDLLLPLVATQLDPANPSETDKIKPERSLPKMTAFKESKATLAFMRKAPARAGQAFTIPNTGASPVTMVLNPDIINTQGTCVFDAFLGQPDSIAEEYSYKLDYSVVANPKQTYMLNSDVKVKYELKRLAPKIDTYLDSNEAPATFGAPPAK